MLPDILDRPTTMTEDRTWYLVLNASTARILRGIPADCESAPVEIVMRGFLRRTRGRIAGHPCEVPPKGNGASQPETDQDIWREDAREFMRDVLGFLETERRAKAFDRLVVIHAANLGELLHEEMPEALALVIKKELARDMVRLSASELAASISDIENQARN